MEFEEDIDDALIVEALEQALKRKDSAPNQEARRQLPITNFYQATPSLPVDAPKFDMRFWSKDPPRHPLAPRDVLSTYQYPTSLDIRSYQYSIIRQALFQNTLVALPTGLGKTFIAAVVMHNFLRWFPEGKVVFVAPTRPLVDQQLRACRSLVGLDTRAVVMMTGTNLKPELRCKEWNNRRRRAYFATAETFRNDLQSGLCPKEELVLVVFDEAHRAQGEHAYCKCVQGLVDCQFRVLALTATPGQDRNKVDEVCQNLHISRIEFRTENSPDVKIYSHETREEIIRVPLDGEVVEIREKLAKWVQPCLDRLGKLGAIKQDQRQELSSWSRYSVVKQRENWRAYCRQSGDPRRSVYAEGDFSILQHLGNAYWVLGVYGIGAFYRNMNEWINNTTTINKKRKEMINDSVFKEMWALVEEYMGRPNQLGSAKMSRMVEILLEHFTRSEEEMADTRAMIFAEYRDIVEEITNILSQQSPIVRPAKFIGQGGKGEERGMSQTQQLDIISQFRRGAVNTLVATCIGEEGLDIGGVDLIICFDTKGSTTRMGRTGRKRQGRVCLLVTEDSREENTYHRTHASYAAVQRAIESGSVNLWEGNSYMLPADVRPTCEQIEIVTEENISDEVVAVERKRNKRQNLDLQQNLEIQRLLDAEERSINQVTGRKGEIQKRELWIESLRSGIDKSSGPVKCSSRTKECVNIFKSINELAVINEASLSDKADEVREKKIDDSELLLKPFSSSPEFEMLEGASLLLENEKMKNEFLFSLSEDQELFLDKIPDKSPDNGEKMTIKENKPEKEENLSSDCFSGDEAFEMALVEAVNHAENQQEKEAVKARRSTKIMSSDDHIHSNKCLFIDDEAEASEASEDDLEDQYDSSFVVEGYTSDPTQIQNVYRHSLQTQHASRMGFGKKDCFGQGRFLFRDP